MNKINYESLVNFLAKKFSNSRCSLNLYLNNRYGIRFGNCIIAFKNANEYCVSANGDVFENFIKDVIKFSYSDNPLVYVYYYDNSHLTCHELVSSNSSIESILIDMNLS